MKTSFRIQKSVITISMMLVLTLSLGTFGYKFFEGWSYFDAFYMTVITITTVGFGEVHPLSANGKILSILVIVLGLIIISWGMGTIIDFIVEGHLGNMIRRNKMEKIIDGLKDHYILCGLGQTGMEIAKEFVATNQRFIVIDNNLEHINAMLEHHSFPYIHGNATDDDTLKKAGIERASGLLTALSEDTDNLFVVLSARDLNPEIRIVSRATSPSIVHKLIKAGAGHVISPNHIGGLRMASVMLRPTVINFLDIMMRNKDTSLRLEEVIVTDKTYVAGKILREAQIPQKTGLMVIAIKKGHDGTYLFNPRSDTRIEKDDHLIVLGKMDQVETLKTYLSTPCCATT